MVVYDGAFGTYVQALDLGPDDFGGEALEGCNELLTVTRPDVIAGMHEAFFRIGVDIVETASFGSFAVPLAEYGIADRSHELNLAVGPHRPRGGRRLRRAGGRLDGPGHQVRLARPDPLRRAARRLRGAGPRPPRGRRGRAPRRDAVRPARRQGRHHRLPPGDGRRRPRGPDPGPGHDRAHRHDAPRHRDRGRPRRPRRDAPRRDRDQLRHRSGRDERAPPLPRPARTHADRVPAQRRPALGRRRQDALRPDAPAAGRLPHAVRHRVRRADRGRLLRHHRRPPPGGRRRGEGPHARAPAAAARGRRHLDLQLHPVRPGPHLPVDRRAHQRQRLQEVPRGDARGRLGHLCGHGPRAGAGGRARARRVRRLRRPRRHGGHGRDRVPLRHAGHRAAHDRLHRAERGRDRPPVDRRPRHPQLGQPRGRRRPRHTPRSLPRARPRVRRRRGLHLHRRGGPGPLARVEAPSGQGDPRPRRRALRPLPRRPVLRPAGPHAGHGHGGEPLRRRQHHRGHPAHQGAPARSAHDARAVEHLLRPQARGSPRPQLGVPPRVRAGRPRLGHRPRRPHHPAGPHPRGAEAGLPRPDLRPADRRLRPAAGPPRDVRERLDHRGREGGPVRLADRAAPVHPHHRGRPRGPHRRPRRGDGRRAWLPSPSSTTSCSRA